ncbi:uncharacterized protein LOC105704371 [Orussus abietinus]|uniref:uncharacterized protein LOC105704371 n=1 Tax=Orussus abietinus TaxID=222816 RepID=UPI000626A48D|nr:uncharacterized protein LOC105704371 [Orussus abietinus]
MTVHQGNRNNHSARYIESSPQESKYPCPAFRNDSFSWDRHSGATSVSWPEELEEVATQRITRHWEAIDRSLFDEADQVLPGPILDECIQWRSQLPHLRVVGRNPAYRANEKVGDLNTDVKRKNSSKERLENEEIIIEDSPELEELHSSLTDDQRERAKEEIFDLILRFLYAEVLITQKDEDSLNEDLDSVLRITPAPTCNGKGSGRGRKIIQKDGVKNVKNIRDVKDSSKVFKQASVGEEDVSPLSENVLSVSARSQKDGVELEKKRLYTPQFGRNKLGTVFNERIIVSPVPFVVSTRESFSTLKTMPIQFMGQSADVSKAPRSSRYGNSGFKTTSARKLSLSQIPHSAWHAPVCPTVWPKNVKLAPIDISRFSNSKSSLPEFISDL